MSSCSIDLTSDPRQSFSSDNAHSSTAPTNNDDNTHTRNHFTALWNLSGTTRVSWYQKKHSPTHTHRGHQSSQSAFSIYYDPWHPPYSIHVLVFLHNLSPSPLGSTSWSQTLHFILHTFLHPIIVFYSQHMPIPSQLLYCCNTETMSSIPSLSLNSLLGTLLP